MLRGLIVAVKTGKSEETARRLQQYAVPQQHGAPQQSPLPALNADLQFQWPVPPHCCYYEFPTATSLSRAFASPPPRSELPKFDSRSRNQQEMAFIGLVLCYARH